MWGNVPGGYRNTINDNFVLILMIETLEGLKNADAIAKVPGVPAIFAASGDLGNFSGFRQGNARLRTRDQHRPRRGDQGQHPFVRTVRLARSSGLHAASRREARRRRSLEGWPLSSGRSRNTQGKVEAGPFATPAKP
jgi:hypothetical protein